MGHVELGGEVWGTRDYQAPLALNEELQPVLISKTASACFFTWPPASIGPPRDTSRHRPPSKTWHSS